ncbi:MAG TPA: nucleoside monophosphate kinase [Candidatus Paceibacterota bacterium]
MVNGKPGAGKSTCCREALERHDEWADQPVSHLSIGSRIRGIVSGAIDSSFASELLGHRREIAGMSLIDYGLAFSVVNEYLQNVSENDAVLLDGFPRQAQQVPLLEAMAKNSGIAILGCISVEISDEESIARQIGRVEPYDRPDTTIEAATRRLAEYDKETVPTINRAQELWGGEMVNGENEREIVTSDFLAKLATRVCSQ